MAAMLISYFVGQKRNAIDYDLKTIFQFTALFGILYAASLTIHVENSIIKMLCNTGLLSVFLLFTFHTLRKDIRLSRTKSDS
jgi:hypothetical protein